MNNINTIDKSNNPKSNGWRNLGYVLMLSGLLNANSPTYAQTNNYNNTTTEQVTPQTNKLNGIKLPTVYQNKIDDFLANNTVMKDEETKVFTINFVDKEMEVDRGINKENQLLFIRHAIYKQTTGNDLYDGKDGNQKIAEDFNNKTINIRIRACGQKFQNKIVAFMNNQSAEARQQSAEARQQSADYDKRIAEARQQSAEAIKTIMQQDSIRLKKSMIEFYEIYIRSPSTVKKEDIDFAKESTKTIIGDCKKYGIDYRAILVKEVGDMEKVDAILKFYGIE